MSEQLQPQLTEAQAEKLGQLCTRYGVEFNPEHYYVFPASSAMMPGWAEGWIGGAQHANPDYQQPEEPALPPTIYIGVSPEGEAHS